MKFLYVLTVLACGFFYQTNRVIQIGSTTLNQPNWYELKNKILIVGMCACFSWYLLRVHWSVALFSAYWLISSAVVWGGASIFNLGLGLDFIARYSMAQSTIWFILTAFILSRFSRLDIGHIVRILWGFSVINSAFSVVQWSLGTVPYGFLGEPSMSAAFNGLLGLYALWYPLGWFRLFFLLNVLSVVLSHSTTAVGILAGGICLYFIFLFKKPWLWALICMAVLAAFIGFGLWFDPGFIKPGTRFVSQHKFFEFFLAGKSILLGWGNGSFLPMGIMLSRKFVEPYSWYHLHSGLLRLFWEGGLIGFLLALNALFFAVKHAWSDKKILGLLIPCVVFFVVQYPEFLPFQGAVCAILFMHPFAKEKPKQYLEDII